YQNFESYNVLANAYLKVNFLNDFSFKISGSTNFSYDKRKMHNFGSVPQYTYWDNQYVRDWQSWNTSVADSWSNSILNNFMANFNYTKTIADKHNVKSFIGFGTEDYRTESLYGMREGYATTGLDALSAGSTENASNSGTIT